MSGMGDTDRMLTEDEVRRVVADALEREALDGQRVLVLVPDLTRSCPLGLMFRLLYAAAAEQVAALDFLIALGTHQPLSAAQIAQRVELDPETLARDYPKARFFNHSWNDPEQLVEVGRLSRQEVGEWTGGLFEMDIAVTCNRMVKDYDRLLIIGPVFPHEVVGFSGGNKYIFPGISGPEVLNFFHWLGAVITNPRIIGNKWTPVRKVIDHAAGLVPVARRAFCMVVRGEGLAGLYYGTPEEAWSQAADLSAQVHVQYCERPYHTVLSCAPRMYDELWTGAKCMYKLEPALADGARLIIYAPHITEVSVAHGRLIEEIGYHTVAYFLAQWDRFKHYPWGVLAHSTHVKGIGRYEKGVETPRVEVVLATGIPEETCRRINLGYLDPATVDPADYQGREAEGVLCVPKAGEILYRWKDAPPELGGPTR
jgi:lactate racemase